MTPLDAWRGADRLTRMPRTLAELDTPPVMVAKPRTVQREGVHFNGLRYIGPTLAACVSKRVTIRYDPRDLAEVPYSIATRSCAGP